MMKTDRSRYIREVELPLLDNRRFTPEWFAARPLTLLVFYKQSCDTCTFLIPYLNRFYRNADAGDSIVLISQDSFPQTETFVRKREIKIPVAVDHPDYLLSRQFDFNGVPASYLVDASGKVVAEGEGFLREETIDFVNQLRTANRLKLADLFLPGEEIPPFKPG